MKWYFILLLILGVLIGIALLYILFLWICSLFIDATKEYEENNRFYRHLLVTATRILIRLSRISVTVEGMELVPKERFLLVANHRSKFDPMISWVVFQKFDITYLSKKENFNIPIFGRFIRKCGFMAVNREDVRQALPTIEKAARMLKSGLVSIGVYPEGTRSNTRELLPFRNGCFKIAQMAEAPIVVVAITGTQKIHLMSPRKRVHVHLKVCEVIPTEAVKSSRTKELGQRVSTDLNEVLSKEDY